MLPALPCTTIAPMTPASAGALLSQQKLETVESGQGMPCSVCVLQHAATEAPTTELVTEAAMPQRSRRS